MFNYFSEASNLAMTSVVGNFSLINKIYIPKYIFPVAKCLFVGINFLLTLIPWFAIILLSYVGLGQYACPINWTYIFLPFLIPLLLYFYSRNWFILIMHFCILKRHVLYLWNHLNDMELCYPCFLQCRNLPTNLQALFSVQPNVPIYHSRTPNRFIWAKDLPL